MKIAKNEHWILPRYWQKDRCGKEGLVQIAFVLLNVGIWLVVAYSVFQASRTISREGA